MSYVSDIYPIKNEENASSDTLVYFNIYQVKLNSLLVKINGETVFDSGSFLYPYDGVSSTYSIISDGYYICINNRNSYADINTVSVSALDLSLDDFTDYWSFIINRKVNTLFLCDGYGLKAVAVRDLAGESQEKIFTVLSESTVPSIPSNDISSILGNYIDGYLFLALSYSTGGGAPPPYGSGIYGGFIYGGTGGGTGGGTVIIRNNVDLYTYMSSNKTYKGVMNDDGTLYVINIDSNSIDVFYGANFRTDTTRDPDYTYDSLSTPAIGSGTILELYIVSGVSTKFRGGTRLYVGTTEGFTRVETYDEQSGGYSTGQEYRGISYLYGVSGSGATYEVIGGTVSKVSKISSSEAADVVFVVTNDAGSGGLTQIKLSQNRMVSYMTYESGLLPSNDVRDISVEE
jgi:hypothetical protein